MWVLSKLPDALPASRWWLVADREFMGAERSRFLQRRGVRIRKDAVLEGPPANGRAR